jgi:plasmid stabilization system protein ParE
MLLVEFHPLAEAELTSTGQYYEGIADGLGADFLREAERTQSFLVQFPGVGRQLTDGSRRVALQRFPYHLVYRLDPDRIWILAVAHHRRQPGYWHSRR